MTLLTFIRLGCTETLTSSLAMADFITIYPLSIGDLIQTIKHKRYTSATLYFMDTKVSGRFFSTVYSVIPCSFDKGDKF